MDADPLAKGVKIARRITDDAMNILEKLRPTSAGKSLRQKRAIFKEGFVTRERRRFLVAGLVGALLSLGVAWPARAQSYPSRPITIVVPVPAGGGPDLVARILAEQISPSLGQTVVVENRTGAGGLLGAGSVAKSPPDGYHLLFTTVILAIAPHTMSKGAGGGIDVQKDLVPIIAAGTTPIVVVANPKLGVTNLRELIALAKKNPGMPFGSGSPGSSMHFAGEMFKREARIDLVHVPYRGVAPSIIGTLAGDTPLLFVALAATLPHISEGKLIPLAVTEKTRAIMLPDVPTATEQGVPGVEVNTWYGIFAPAGTPPLIVDRINKEVNAALKLAEVRAKLDAVGVEVTGGEPGILADFLKKDDQRYGDLARELNLGEAK